MRTTDADLSFDQKTSMTYHYFNQGKLWAPKGRPAVWILDMEPEWRFNASRWLEQRAAYFAMVYTLGEIAQLSAPTMREVVNEINGVPVEHGPLFSHLDLMGDHARDAFDAEQEARTEKPIVWLHGTHLYRALVADLPTGRKKLAKLAARSRHFTTCPARTDSGDCACHVPIPEWTQ